MKTDLQIAQENTMDNIEKIARKAKIDPDYLEVYGKNKMCIRDRNQRALKFYLKEGFVIHKQLIDEETGEIEFLMQWKRS